MNSLYVKDEEGNVQLRTVPVGEISEGIQAALCQENAAWTNPHLEQESSRKPLLCS
jgi:hypothetical protein